jgi:hypothetical protein
VWHNRALAVSDPGTDNAAAEELASLRAEVERLRAALAGRQPAPRRLMEPDPDLPGLSGLWRGERGLGWQLFVQATVSVNAVLAVVAVITIASS